MTFPRIKEFNFDIDKTFVVPSQLVGRLDRIAFELFGEHRYYKPLASANNIKMSHGFRTGIRLVEDSLKIELKDKGLNDNQVDEVFNEKMNNKRSNGFDWLNYYDVSYGYVSEVEEGLVLLVPTFESATQYLNQFEFIEENN